MLRDDEMFSPIRQLHHHLPIDEFRLLVIAQFPNEFPPPGLVLLDLKLPYVMGLDVLKWIRQQPALPVVVIILSSSSELSDIKTAYRLGANAYLVKPPDVSKLVEVAKSIKDVWLTHNVLPAE